MEPRMTSHHSANHHRGRRDTEEAAQTFKDLTIYVEKQNRTMLKKEKKEKERIATQTLQ